MERGLMMLFHSFLIGFVLYFIMVMFLQQSMTVAEDRSILIAAIILIYMLLFGHKMPTEINKNIIS